ncbi:MAG TPA: GTPase Era [Actinomycetota bacterium]|nr:GTPase Era [Actinomycetota bacterium]
MTDPPFRSGVVAVVGRPNVGKSTLVNALLGEKVAIVSDKPQTTRRGLHAVWNGEGVQVVFTDTPGVHKPVTLMGARMNDAVGDAVHGVDLVLHVVDAEAGVGSGDAYVYEQRVQPAGAHSVCAVNKIDALRAHAEIPQLAAAAALGEYDEIVPVSAARGDGVELLRELIAGRMPEGPPLYPDGMRTDQPLEIRLAEIVREKALAVTREEVPHSIAVVVDEVERDERLTKVFASVYVERESQKGIVIGRGGQTLRTIGTRAREDIEAEIGGAVYLDLQVKVLKEWQRDPRALERLGF